MPTLASEGKAEHIQALQFQSRSSLGVKKCLGRCEIANVGNLTLGKVVDERMFIHGGGGIYRKVRDVTGFPIEWNDTDIGVTQVEIANFTNLDSRCRPYLIGHLGKVKPRYIPILENEVKSPKLLIKLAAVVIDINGRVLAAREEPAEQDVGVLFGLLFIMTLSLVVLLLMVIGNGVWYIFKALLKDQLATALVTFFTLNADVLTGRSCTELVKKYGVPDPREFPDEILSLNGRTHIFQIHYNPSCVQGRVDFYFDDILDKPLQIGTPVQLPQTSITAQTLTVTPLPITPETPGTYEQPTASTAASLAITESVSSDTPSIPTPGSETTTKNVKRALFETESRRKQEEKGMIRSRQQLIGVEEESMPVYDTDIKDVIEKKEGFVGKGGFGGKKDNIKDVVVVANDLCSSMIQTTLSVNFELDINTKSHKLMWFGKSIILK
ncbi:hypothetical protein Tco_0704795, partial [Tanacetum coccineum]